MAGWFVAPRKILAGNVNRALSGFQEEFSEALESTLPPHSNGVARRVLERIESCFHSQSEFLLRDLLACPSPVQDESDLHGSRAGRKTSVV